MRFFELVVSGAALISSAFAVTIDTYPSSVVAGQSYTVTYSPKDQPATFLLRKGLSTDLKTIATLGTATGGSFTFTPDKSLANGNDYALQVIQGTDNNYSGQFPLTGGSTAAVSSALASASAALSSASAAASSIRASASSVLASASSVAASATIRPSAGLNSTVSTATLSSTASASGTSKPTTSTTTGGIPQSTGAASMLESSPLAIIFGAIAAFAYFH